ncbi:stage II sporulation protein E [ANME-1 cluster archaeon AG-394-G21]|nr:stage II sporulation protein E [ANME-1 cluster archaeon AG-394-G21]
MAYPIIELLVVLVEKICVIVVIAYLITRTKYFREILDKKFTLKNCVIFILIFGAVSIFGTYSGIKIPGAIANVRDLGPMIAGLIGGPVIGLGAGLIGGIHRYFLGGFTCVPCSLATVLAGLFGGIIYILRRGKFIGVPGAVLFAALMESFHMILALILVRPYSEAVKIVVEVSIPMIFANSLGMFFFAYIISNRIRELETAEERDKYSAELERKRYELQMAHDIQQSFLPDAIPDLPGFELAAQNIPAKEVGGDFYDFIPISRGKIGLTIADVSGKGVPAALFMALSRTIVRAKATRSSSVREVIRDANSLIMADAKSGMFVTLFYAVLDVSERTLTYVRAGHNPPVIFKAKTRTLMRLDAKGIALGAIADIELEERKIILDGGDIVVFYTDGVTEAINKSMEQFGEERLITTIKVNHELSANDMIEKIKGEMLAFCGDEPQFDDITLMALKAE